MDIRLLGPVTAYHDGLPVDLGRRQERCLLGLLLLEDGHVVSTERLVHLLWGESAPPRARATVHTYVHRLRARLAPYGVELVTCPPGYLTRTGGSTVDVHRFTSEVTRARGLADPSARAETLRAALALWRGPLLADVADDRLRERLSAVLDEQRLVAMELYAEAELERGRHTEVIGELMRWTRRHPTRETLVAHLMTALYRGGQRAEALATYRRTRSRLVGELGIEPGADLQLLHRRMLVDDPGLCAPGPAAEGRPGRRFLPHAVPDFTGRAAELARLDALFAAGAVDTATVAAITGPAGVGKTAFAVHWATGNAHRFPGGLLYVDLHGYDERPPLTPTDALAALLRQLDAAVPSGAADLDALVERYRDAVAERRVLILLDDARDPDQVRPLLAGGGGCAVLVTSRNRMTGLLARDGVHRIALDVLTLPDSVALLARILPDRVAAEAEAAAALATATGRLPLALRIAAANLDDTATSISAYVAALLRGDRLAALAVPDDPSHALAALVGRSYHEQPAEARAVFRGLGTLPGATFTPELAAAMVACPVVRMRPLLDTLAASHLLEEPAPGRYALHDLLRLYAGERARAEEDPGQRDQALARVLAYYLAAVARCDSLLRPGRGVGGPQVADVAEDLLAGLDTGEAASAWLDAELPNLLLTAAHAAGTGHALFAHRLACAVAPALGKRADWLAELTLARLAVKAAQQCGQESDRAQAALLLGRAELHLGRPHAAAGHFAAALDRSRADHDDERVIAALVDLARAVSVTGDSARAAELLGEARSLARAAGLATHEAVILVNLASTYQDLDRWDDAAGALEASLAIRRERGDTAGMAVVLPSLGHSYCRDGRYAEALASLDEAVTVCRAVGNQVDEWHALTLRAHTLRQLGRVRAALAAARAAERLAARRMPYEHSVSLRQVADLAGAAGHRRMAAEYGRRAAEARSAYRGPRVPALEALLFGAEG